MSKTKVLQGFMWFWAAFQLVNALLTTVLLDQGAAIYGISEWVKNPQTRYAFHQYGMVLFVLAATYGIIATDVVKYEKLLWVVVVEQVAGAIWSTQEMQQAGILSGGQFSTVHIAQGIVILLLWFLRPSADKTLART
jgi:hypothetical protein